ncbi:protein translocase subunit SecD [Planctomycetota bacterium]
MPKFWDRLVDSLPRESKNLVWRTPLVIAVIVVSLFIFIPFNETPYAIKVVQDVYDREKIDLTQREVVSYEVTNRLVRLTSPFHYQAERELSSKPLKPKGGKPVRERKLEIRSGGLNLGLDLRGGTELLYRILQEGDKAVASAEEIKEVIQKRVDAYGLREPRIQAQGTDRILIQLPGQASGALETIKSVIQNIGHLEFRIVADPKSQAHEEWKKAGMAKDPPGYTTYTVRSLKEDKYVEQKILISNDVKMTGKYIRATRVISAGSGQSFHPSVGLSFTPVGEQVFASVTGENVGKRLAIVLNTRRDGEDAIIDKGTCYSAPNIRTRIFGDAVIEGDFSEDECKALRTVLMAGSLPAPLALESENTVGPSLGPALIAKGVRAIAIGFAMVVVFMLLYYRFAGFVADFALILNLLIIVSVMILFDATLTLPGIAGLLLTIGMSVDANVLIFERIREEMGTTGDKPLRLAVRDGYGRAFWTIFDANLTTLLTAAILWWRGTGAIKGFAIVLMIGILTSMFTALIVTRVIFDLLTWRRWLTRLPMAQIIKRPSIGFMRLRNKFLIGSIVAVALGVAWFVYRGEDNWDVDFRGGQLIHVVFKEPLDADEIGRKLTAIGPEFEDCEVQSIAASAGEGVATLPGRKSTEFVIRFPALSEAVTSNVRVGPVTGAGTVDIAVTLHNPMRIADLEQAMKTAKIFGYGPTPVGEPDADGKHAAFTIGAPIIDVELARKELEKALATHKPADQASAFAAFKAGEPKINYRTTGEVTIDRPIALATINQQLVAGGDFWKVEPKGDAVGEGRFKAFFIGSSLDNKPAFRARVGKVFASQAYDAVIREQFADLLAPEGIAIQPAENDRATLTITLTKLLQAATLTEKLQTWAIAATLKGTPPPEATSYELDVAADKAEELATQVRKDTETFALSTAIPRVAKVGPAVAKQMLIWAAVAIAAASVLIIAYVWLRFERFKYGIAAVAALLHDVLITIGILSVIGTKFNLPIVAALLTIIGYSINDTIVVFDRIRENLRRERKRDVDASIIDNSINQVLSRTILTSVTTLLAVLSLFLFAGGVIQDFALALLIGVFVGTYSSIFIASPLLILHQEQIEKRLKKR